MDQILRKSLREILDLINRIEELLQGIGFEDFANDRKIKIGVVHNYEQLFDALETIPGNIRDQNPGIHWSELMELKQKIVISDYGISDEEVWNISKHKLKKIGRSIKSVVDM